MEYTYTPKKDINNKNPIQYQITVGSHYDGLYYANIMCNGWLIAGTMGMHETEEGAEEEAETMINNFV